jgi:asparaginyl-tRNA synthetase
MNLIEKLKFVQGSSFIRLTYTEAIDILKDSKPYKKNQFQFPVDWGIDLQSEHERYLVEKHFKCPVILTDYPREIKAFYMKQNDDGKTVRAMDVLFPQIGEIIGGSQREENLEKLLARMKKCIFLPLRCGGTLIPAGMAAPFTVASDWVLKGSFSLSQEWEIYAM